MVVDQELTEKLHTAIWSKNFEAAEFLLQSGANVNAPMDDRNWTPLHHSIHISMFESIFEITKIFVKYGADVNARIRICLSTPLHIAARSGHFESVQLLLENGAQINALDYEQNTPLHLAAKLGYHEIVEILLKYGARKDLKNEANLIPLSLVQAYKFFLKNGIKYPRNKLDFDKTIEILK